MASKSEGSAKVTQTQASDRLEYMGAFSGMAFEVFSQACWAYASGVAQLNGELMGFANTRMNRDVELSHALSKCDSWPNAVGLQQDWARQATQEYLAEASKLMELASKVATESWEPAHERADQALAELNKPAS